MGWFERILGGTIGFTLGGPLGAVLGAVAGDLLLTRRVPEIEAPKRPGRPGPSRDDELRTVYFVATFSMLGKLAKADGRVSRQEIAVVESFIQDQLRLDAEHRKFAIGVFREAKDSAHQFGEFARQFGGVFATEPLMLESMLELLVRVSMADGHLHPSEDRLLAEAARCFGFSDAHYESVRARLVPQTDGYYRTLGLSRQASDDELRRTYRRLALEYHPDKIIAKGMPEEFVEVAKKKFQEIQQAYDAIKQARGIA